MAQPYLKYQIDMILSPYLTVLSLLILGAKVRGNLKQEEHNCHQQEEIKLIRSKKFPYLILFSIYYNLH